MGVFPHTEHLLEEERQKENWREAERLIKALQASAGGGGPPTGAAGGDLSGTYPNPQIAAGAIADADISSAAAIDATKIGAGGVTSTEFGYIGTLTSDAQTQINAKAGTGSANTFTLGQLFPDGSASSNALARSADVTTGINFAAAAVAIATSGTNRFTVSATTVTSTLPFRAASGSAAAPSYSFTSVTTGGVYAPAANSVGISTSSTLRFIVSAASYIRASLPFVLTSGALCLGGTLISGGGTTTNILTTDSSRIVVDTVSGGETLQWYAASALTSPLDGAFHVVTDAQKNAATNNIVITDSGGTTIGTINTNGGSAIVQVDRVNNLYTCNVIA